MMRTFLVFDIFLMLLFLAGCSRPTMNRPVWTEGRASGLLEQARQAPLPQDRMSAIEQLSGSRFIEWWKTVQVLGTILRTDSTQAVREVAAIGLGRSRQTVAIDALVMGLGADINRGAAFPADVQVRRAILKSLDQLLAEGVVYNQPEVLVREVGGVLSSDRDVQVKIDAARVLGHVQNLSGLRTLIESLRTANFSVTYTVEQSLTRLTGVTHHRHYESWVKWLENNPRPFVGNQR